MTPARCTAPFYLPSSRYALAWSTLARTTLSLGLGMGAYLEVVVEVVEVGKMTP